MPWSIPGTRSFTPTPVSHLRVGDSLCRRRAGTGAAFRRKRLFLDVAHLETLITPKTKLIILNSPQNPTGGLIPLDDLKRIAVLAIRHDLWVLSDEVYSRLIYEGEFASIASLPGMQERTIILDGFPKPML
jgi:aspartate/methionine/tyrosine aminotransferase